MKKYSRSENRIFGYLEYLAESKTPQSGYIKETNTEDETADMFRAWFHDNLDRLKSLLDDGYNINAKDTNGDTLLIRSVAASKIDSIKLLLKYEELDVNVKSGWGDYMTALHLASQMGDNKDIVSMLLEDPRIDVYIKDYQGRNFIDVMNNFPSLTKKKFLVDYDLQKTIIENNEKNILLFDKYGLVHPKIKEEYPDLFNAGSWGLIGENTDWFKYKDELTFICNKISLEANSYKKDKETTNLLYFLLKDYFNYFDFSKYYYNQKNGNCEFSFDEKNELYEFGIIFKFNINVKNEYYLNCIYIDFYTDRYQSMSLYISMSNFVELLYNKILENPEIIKKVPKYVLKGIFPNIDDNLLKSVDWGLLG